MPDLAEEKAGFSGLLDRLRIPVSADARARPCLPALVDGVRAQVTQARRDAAGQQRREVAHGVIRSPLLGTGRRGRCRTRLTEGAFLVY